MSEALLDEIEALNSIYGDNTLVPSPSANTKDEYILTLPPAENDPDPSSSSSTSLRLRIPSTYPDSRPPAVLGTYSIGANAKRGKAARDLEVFSQVLAEVWEREKGAGVILFDVLEGVRAFWEEGQEEGGQEAEEEELNEAEEEEGYGRGREAREGLGGEREEEEEPQWIISDPVIELKSVFVARCAKVTSPEQAARYVQHLLATDKKVRGATHNMTAWRIRGESGVSFQDCDDDGETAAGGRLLHLMQLMDLWDVMVIVTRWYGGQKLGPRRFALINMAARDAFVKAGLVTEISAGGAKKKGQGK